MMKTLPNMLRRISRLLPLLGLISCSFLNSPDTYLPRKSALTPGEIITVQGTQNVYSIAQQNGVSMRDIIVLNDLHSPFAVHAGQRLVLPSKDGSSGFSSSPVGIGGSGVDTGSLAPAPLGGAPLGSVQTQSLAPIETQELPPPLSAAPRGVAPAPAGAVAPRANVLGKTTPSAPMESLNTPSPPPRQVATTLEPILDSPAPASSASVSGSAPSFVWPVKGPVLSGFGPKGQGVNNDGVNIGAPKGAPVVAAGNGIVVYAGNDMKGFGNMILIRHEGGWVTAYAHLDRVLVSKDAAVAQGDMIGTVGKTGNISSPQLHFETRQNSKAIDPNEIIH